MSYRTDAIDILTLVAKIFLAVGATSLLVLDSFSDVPIIAPDMSLVSMACLGVTVSAFLLIVAYHDIALAILICIFIACGLAVLSKNRNKQAQALVSDHVSRDQAASRLAQQNRDNDALYMHSVDTPLPTPNQQMSLPMAYTMTDKSYSPGQ